MPAHAVQVTDTFLALTDREKYLQSKERLLINCSTLFSDCGLNDDNPFFTEDIVNDPNILKLLKELSLIIKTLDFFVTRTFSRSKKKENPYFQTN